MPPGAGESADQVLVGTLRFNDLEGGFWSLELDEVHPEFGDHVVLQEWAPTALTQDGSRVRARVREAAEQFGFLMAGPMVDVLELTPVDA
jgi:hypothetical protein